jgi:hypothetical protein
MAITTKANVEKYLLTAIDSSFDAQITAWIAAAEKHINRMTNRQIIADTAPAEYKYSGNKKDYMHVDDFIDIDTVEMDGVDITDDIFFEPANRLPYFKLVYDEGVFEKGKQNIVVTGRRGYADSAAIPEDLVFAATVLVAGIVNFSNNSSGEIKSESIGGYSVTYVSDSQKNDFTRAEAIIKSYRRIR